MFKGAKAKISFLMSETTVQDAAKHIFDGILLSKHYVIFPKFLYLAIAIKACLPYKATRAIADLFAQDETMDGFVGRENEPTTVTETRKEI